MTRTQLVLGFVVVAGGLFPVASIASTPCPPATVSVQGGASVSTSCDQTTTPTSGNGSYSTDFNATENPISEGGRWENKFTRTFAAYVSTSGGRAFGLGSSGYNDSVAVLTGTYGRDQTITATAYRGGASGAAEIELHLRMRMVPSSEEIYTYEVDICPSLGAVALVKWAGVQGQFTRLAEVAFDGVADGDVFTASAIGPGNSTVFTIKKNGKTILTYTDTAAFTTGNPGIGFDAGTPTAGQNLGWTSYSVTTAN
jgi:hypothetical protein